MPLVGTMRQGVAMVIIYGVCSCPIPRGFSSVLALSRLSPLSAPDLAGADGQGSHRLERRPRRRRGSTRPALTVPPASATDWSNHPGIRLHTDQQIYEQNKAVADGLGPVYNATSCVMCHQDPNSGAAGQITELRVGHNDANGNFVNPTIYINDGQNTITGRSIVNDRAIGPQAQEHIPATENIRALRATLNTLGDGFVEAIDDNTLIAIAAAQPKLSDGKVNGEVVQAPMFEAPGQTRVGRFGWKDQHSSLLSFIADAYLNEMGITSRLRPTEVTAVLLDHNGHQR